MIAPGSKKPILKVEGEWNGKMMAKWATGRNEIFIDVPNTTIWPKKCKKVAEQGRFESRRLWKDVTYGLKVRLRRSSQIGLLYIVSKCFSTIQ